MNNKYEILYDQKEQVYDGVYCYRIKALKDFDDVKIGDIGGCIQSEKNLSQEGNCWIYDDAVVINDSSVSENAKVRNKAYIADNVRIYGNATILDNPYIIGQACIFDNAIVSGFTYIDDYALIYGNSEIKEYAEVGGKSNIYGNSTIEGSARIYNSRIDGHEYTDDDNKTYPGKVHIFNNAFVFDCCISGYDIEISKDIKDAEISYNAKIFSFVNGAEIGYNGFIIDDHMYWIVKVPYTPFDGTIYVGIDNKLYYENELIDDMLESYKEDLNTRYYDRKLTNQILDIIQFINRKRINCGGNNEI